MKLKVNHGNLGRSGILARCQLNFVLRSLLDVKIKQYQRPLVKSREIYWEKETVVELLEKYEFFPKGTKFVFTYEGELASIEK